MPRTKFQVISHMIRPGGGTYCGKEPPLPDDDDAWRHRIWSKCDVCEEIGPTQYKTGRRQVPVWYEIVPRL